VVSGTIKVGVPAGRSPQSPGREPHRTRTRGKAWLRAWP